MADQREPDVAWLRRQVDEGTAALKAELGREQSARALLEQRLASQDEALNTLREKLGETGAANPPTGGLPSFLREVRETFGRELKDCVAAQKRIEQRCDDLAATVGDRDGGLMALVERLQAEASEEADVRQKEILELREELGVEAHEREKHKEELEQMVKRKEPEESPERVMGAGTLQALEERIAETVAQSQEQNAYLQDRVRMMERMLSETADAHARELESVHARLQEKLNERLWEFHGSLRDLCCALQERVDRLEEGKAVKGTCSPDEEMDSLTRLGEMEAFVQEMRQLAEARQISQSQDLQELHGKLSEEVEARDVAHMSMKARLDSLERNIEEALQEQAGKCSEAMQEQQSNCNDAIRAHASKCNEDVQGVLTALRTESQATQRLHNHLDDEREAREVHEAWVKDSLAAERENRAHYERAMGSQVEAVVAELARLKEGLEGQKQAVAEHCDALVRCARETQERSFHAHSAEEQQARDENQAFMKAQDASLKMHEEAIRMQEECFKELSDEQRQIAIRIASEKEHSQSMEAQLSFVTERLTTLARLVGETPAEPIRPIRQHLASLEQRLEEVNKPAALLQERLEVLEKQPLEQLVQRQVQAVVDSHASEVAAAIKTLQGALQRHLEEELGREHSVRSASDSALNERLTSLEKRHSEDVQTLASELRGAPQAGFYNTVSEHLASEKKARESHERLLQSQVSQEKACREQHMLAVQEQLSQVMQEVSQQPSQEACQQLVQEVMVQERARIEAVLSQEREKIKEALTHDKGEQDRQHTAVSARVDSLQRTLDIFDTIVRKEITERSEEGRRLRLAFDEVCQAVPTTNEDPRRRGSLQQTGQTLPPCKSEVLHHHIGTNEHEVPVEVHRPSTAAIMSKPVAVTVSAPQGTSTPNAPRPVLSGGNFCASPQRGTSAPMGRAAPPPQVVISTGSFTAAPSMAAPVAAVDLSSHVPRPALGPGMSGMGSPPPPVNLRHSNSSGSLLPTTASAPAPPMHTSPAVHSHTASGGLCTVGTGSWQPPPLQATGSWQPPPIQTSGSWQAAPPQRMATQPLVQQKVAMPVAMNRSFSNSPPVRGDRERPTLPHREVQQWMGDGDRSFGGDRSFDRSIERSVEDAFVGRPLGSPGSTGKP